MGYNPSYKWINPTYPIYNWGYNPLTKWDEPPSNHLLTIVNHYEPLLITIHNYFVVLSLRSNPVSQESMPGTTGYQWVNYHYQSLLTSIDSDIY